MAHGRTQYYAPEPYAPSGYVDALDAAAMAYRTQYDKFTYGASYAFAAAGVVDLGDETFGGSTFAYIPVDFAGLMDARTERMYAAGALVSELEPQTPQWPALGSILSSMYSGLNTLWQKIASEQGVYNDW